MTCKSEYFTMHKPPSSFLIWNGSAFKGNPSAYLHFYLYENLYKNDNLLLIRIANMG